MTIDYHSHILPSMDDGARDIDESIKLLSVLRSQGVNKVCLTPHYNVSGTVSEWDKNRKASFEILKNAAEGKDLPALQLGAEVLISKGISNIENFEKLIIEGTDYILLELPWRKYSPWMSEEIDSIIAKYKVTPILAHIDRYLTWYKLEDFFEKFDFADVVYQINVSSLKSLGFRMKVKKLMKKGYRIVFGSDTHSIDERPPHFDLFQKHIDKNTVENVL
ncbi:MAG: capsular polysaccharide biosynthesis protein [Clostridia bacterium]|nr:capsular polysaccharide biosynthesis protein [Clostridia bacterium]